MSHKLKNIRESHGLSVRELHELSNIAEGTIRRIENNDLTYKVNDDTAKLLANALYLDVADIFEPRELSPLGRPPTTGKPLTHNQKTEDEICTGCNLAKPKTGICDACEELPLAG